MRTELSIDRRRWIALFLATFAWLAAVTPSRAEDSGSVDFSRDVLPILSDNCFLCHGPDPKTRQADLRLDVREGALRTQDAVILPGKSGESEFIHRIISKDPEEVMPPPKSGHTLTIQQVEALKRWVDQGAKWGKHWALETPRAAEPPKVKDAAWPRNPIDQFVLHKLEAENLRPTPEADKVTLIRRVSLDLTGLPPSPKEVDAFLADTRADAYDRLVDRLLESSRYGERQAMEWLDQARFADTNGYQNDFARSMWPWRDWVINAFNSNQRFDQFAIEQLAGDLLPNATRAQRIATGFNRNNRTVTEAGSIEEEWRIENAVDRVETTATVFMGLTLGCARCHDHKYDPVTQKEFYQFLGFFNSVNEKGVYTETRGNVPPMLQVPSAEEEARLAQLASAITAAEQLVKQHEAGMAARLARWVYEQRVAPNSPDPKDWALRIPLDGSLQALSSVGNPADPSFAGAGQPNWVEGPAGKGVKFDGQPTSFVDAGQVVDLERTSRFSYGAWVKPVGDGTILSKMDEAGGYRGIDVMVGDAKLAVHLVNAWPQNAIKVTTETPLPRDAWSHVLVTYDGSSKAAGVVVYVNGVPAKLAVEADTLKDTIVTAQPLRLGKRSASSPFNGEIADVRIYRRTLSREEVLTLIDAPAYQLARTPANERTPTQQARLAKFARERLSPELVAADAALAKVRQERTALEGQVATVMVMEDQPQPRDTFLLKRGRYEMPDTTEKLQPGVPDCLPPLPSDARRDRLALARWLVAPENPLTSRVTVNRFWQQHFGNGLVKTAENFGLQSEPPSHRELLDWLSIRFIRSGWDVKALHRLIVTSATYRQGSQASAELTQRDPENRLLAHGPRFRLPAEVVRDNALAIGGLLTEKLGGPSIKPYQPAGLWEELAGGAGEAPYVQDKGPNLYRRSLYIYRKRTVPHPTMSTFDAPSREVCQVKRPRTNTPLQALELLNDVTYVEAARQLARLMLTEGGQTIDDRIAYAFRRAISRPPTARELEVLKRGFERYRKTYETDADAAAKFVGHGDSPLIPGIDAKDLAAYAATASVILNLDETITLE